MQLSSPIMVTQRKKTGDYGEQLATQYLIDNGYEIITRNWRCTEGELDVVAQQGQMLVFVEVRTRRGERLGSPEESITPQKQAKLIALAYTYLDSATDPNCAWRIDVIAVQLGSHNRLLRLNHIDYAVGE